MPIFDFDSKRLSFFYRITFIFLSLFVLHRLAFFITFYNSNEAIGWQDLAYAFYIGFRFDLRCTVLYSFLLLLMNYIPFLGPLRSKWGEKIWVFISVVLFLGMQFLYVSDYLHYSYLGSRVNAAVLEYLSDFFISLQMVWETYPVVSIFLGLFTLGAIFRFILKRFVFNIVKNKENTLIRSKKKLTIQSVFTGFFIVFSLWGTFSFFPLRWSDAYFSFSSFATQAALNPFITVSESIKFSNKEYDINVVKENYHFMADYLGMSQEERDHKKLTFKRKVKPTLKFDQKPNVVIILAESLAYFMTGLSGNPLNATPFTDGLSKESILFDSFYVPVQATARSVFGLVTGIPDVTHVETSTRNPLIVDQHSILNDFKNYNKHYFLGGSASWGNIRGLLGNNVDGLKIFEESSTVFNRNDVWGISDYKLAEIANAEFKDEEKPFVAIFQTSGFHRPYTIPDEKEDKGDFEEIQLSEEELKKYGFDHNEQYNSLRFQDHSIKHLFELAKKEKYFKNTIFIIFGDHGLPVNGATHVPLAQRTFDFENFHVPLIVYGPKFFPEPKVDHRYISEVDILPTIGGLIGEDYTNTTLGRDIFDPQFDDQRYCFSFFWYARPPRYMAFGKDDFYLGGIGNQVKDKLWISPDRSQFKVIRDFSHFDFEKLAHSFFHTSLHLMRNNKKSSAAESN